MPVYLLMSDRKGIDPDVREVERDQEEQRERELYWEYNVYMNEWKKQSQNYFQ